MVLIIIREDSGKISPGTSVAGVPLLRRIVMAASRAGCHDILVVDSGQPGLARLLEGTQAMLLSPSELAEHPSSSRILVLASNLLPHPSLLKRLSDMPLRPGTMHAPTSGIAAVETVDPQGLLSSIGHAIDGVSVFSDLEHVYRKADATMDGEAWVRVSRREDLSHAERWLLRDLIKDTEGFMSRHFERKVSLAITRWLVHTDFTPIQMTALSVAIGLLGAVLFLPATPFYELSGALLFLLHSILDGCDGEIARLKNLESRLGGILDFWGDNLVHSAVFLCMGLGWQNAADAPYPLLLAFSAVVGTLLSAAFVYRRTFFGKTSEGSPFSSVTPLKTSSRLSPLADTLARRDFIYVVVILSAWGKIRWFLVLAAIGAPLYFLMLLWISHREKTHA